MQEDALCSVTERTAGTSPSPRPTPVPQGLGILRGRDGTWRGETVAVEEAAGALRWPDPASLLREQRAAPQRLWRPLNHQWGLGGSEQPSCHPSPAEQGRELLCFK